MYPWEMIKSAQISNYLQPPLCFIHAYLQKHVQGGTVGIPLGVLVYWPQKIKYIGEIARDQGAWEFWRQYVVFWHGPTLYFIKKTWH